jgi:hypothetical protein
MKARLPIVFIFALGLALLFTWAVTAQRTETKTDAQSSPYLGISSVSHIELHPIHPSAVNLAYTSEITFTPAFTIFLPLIQFTPPCTIAPVLISPTNGSLLNTLVPVLTYIRGTAPVSYTVISIADNPAFNSPIEYSSSGGGFGPFQLQLFYNLQPATMYYWRVQDKCGPVYSPYSSVFSFTTGSGGIILPAPTLVSPVSGTLGLGQQVTVTWNSMVGAVGYQVWSHQVGPYGNWLYFVSGDSLVLRYLQPNTTYEWWVIAYNDYAYGTSSDKWLFSTGSFTSLRKNAIGSQPGKLHNRYYSSDQLIQHIVDDR